MARSAGFSPVPPEEAHRGSATLNQDVALTLSDPETFRGAGDLARERAGIEGRAEKGSLPDLIWIGFHDDEYRVCFG